MNKSIIGIVDSLSEAQSILGDLRRVGFENTDVSILSPDQHGERDFGYLQRSKAPEAGLLGTCIGGAVGAVLGLLASFGALALPGLDVFVIAGPVIAALSGGAAGAAVGGITGALAGLGVPEIEAKRYDGKVQGGSILIAVHVESNDLKGITESVLTRGGAHDIVTTHEAPVRSGR
jgi:hypothetical protein